MRQDNEKISRSAFLNDPVKAVGNSNVGATLQQDVKTALTGPINGLLNKKFFTARDRQVAEDVLAKAVILSMISSGRKAAAPSAIETAYMGDAAGTMDKIKKSEAFQNAKGKVVSPDSLRKFLTENRQAEVNKNFSKSAVEQKNAASNEAQKQNSIQFEYKLQIQQPQPRPEPKPQGLGGPAGV